MKALILFLLLACCTPEPAPEPEPLVPRQSGGIGVGDRQYGEAHP